jgi:hypothetical protein
LPGPTGVGESADQGAGRPAAGRSARSLNIALLAGTAAASPGSGEFSPDSVRAVIAALPGRSEDFAFEGGTYRFAYRAAWAAGGLRYRYDVVPLQQGLNLLGKMAVVSSIPKPQREALAAAARVLQDNRADTTAFGVLLLRLAAAPAATVARGPTVTPSQLRQTEEPKTYWIEIQLLDDQREPIADEPYLIVAPDNQEYPGVTDSDGLARIDGLLAPGECKISFPSRDKDHWDRH